MVSSTAIPKPIVNITTVENFKSTPINPINPATNKRGNTFGIKEIRAILEDLKIMPISNATTRKLKVNPFII